MSGGLPIAARDDRVGGIGGLTRVHKASPGRRPYENADILSHDEVVVAAITTTFPEPPPAEVVPLPWHPTGRVATGLTRRSGVVCNWVVAVNKNRLEPTPHRLPMKHLEEVMRRIGNRPEPR